MDHGNDSDVNPIADFLKSDGFEILNLPSWNPFSEIVSLLASNKL